MEKGIRFLPVVLPLSIYTVFIAARCSGFYMLDDWVYVLSFQYLAEGDAGALWAPVCEHRAVFAKLAHFLCYGLGFDGKPLLFISQGLQGTTALLLIAALSRELAFPKDAAGRLFAVFSATALTLVLFTPVQAWAMVRSTYVEAFLCVLGGVVVVVGLTRSSVWLLTLGIVLSLLSTPGWIVLLPFFLVVTVLFRVFPLAGNAFLRKYGPVFFILLCLVLIIYKLPFEHPAGHVACSHPSMLDMLKSLFVTPGRLLLHFIAYLGFVMSWMPGVFVARDALTTGQLLWGACLFGALYVVGSLYFLWEYFVRKHGSCCAVLVLIWTLLMGGALTLSRSPVLDVHFIRNYFYPVYVVPGWAVLLYLLVHKLHGLMLVEKSTVAKKWLLTGGVLLVCLTIPLSFVKGLDAMQSSARGVRYLEKRYREAFIQGPVPFPEQQETAAVIFPAFPDMVLQGTTMLKDLQGFPEAWKQ